MDLLTGTCDGAMRVKDGRTVADRGFLIPSDFFILFEQKSDDIQTKIEPNPELWITCFYPTTAWLGAFFNNVDPLCYTSLALSV